MDKNKKKLEYQELFLSELRNSHFGEKKIEDALRELETKENMEKLTRVLKRIWKQADENIKSLEETFPKSESLVSEKSIAADIQINVNFDAQKNKTEELRMEKRRQDISDLKNLQVVSYDHLVELVDDLNIEEVTEILTAVAGEEKNDHQYLTKLAEKLLIGNETKKVPDSKS